MKKSLVYILTNPSFPNYVKIGKTTDLKKRIKKLSDSDCLPFSFRAYATYETEDLDVVEKAIHTLIDMIDYDLRAREEVGFGRVRKREFFALDAENAFEILLQIATLRGDEENVSRFELTAEERIEEQTAKEVEKRVKRSRALSFSEYGIPIGSELSFTNDPSIIVKVIGDRKIEYQGKEYSMSGLAEELMNVESVQGPLYFKYNGKVLTEIRRELEHRCD